MPSALSSPAGLFTPPFAKYNRLTTTRDDQFNSITGLNGSGKSNILDAICFVLGITNMSTVRAQNLNVRRKRKYALARLTPQLGFDLQAWASRRYAS
jgi:recombinational DNA repair ATPase RecF